MSQIFNSKSQNLSNTSPQKHRSLFRFFVLVFVFSFPIWLFGAISPLELMPGVPIASLMTFCPMIAASVLVYREGGFSSFVGLLGRSLDAKRPRPWVWYVPAIFIMPAIMFLTYGLMRIFDLPLPDPQFPVYRALVMLPVFFIAALGEETGWTGYAMEPLLLRWSTLSTGLILGCVTAAWHVVPLFQVGRSPDWIAWQCLTIIAQRVIIVWLYKQAEKSVFVAILFHVMVNISWQFFPNSGSHYDPKMTGLVSALVAIAVNLVGKHSGGVIHND